MAKGKIISKLKDKITGNDRVLESLSRLNIGVAAALVVQALALVILSNTASVPVTTSFLSKDALASAAAGQTVWAGATRHLFDLRLIYLVAAFLLISALVRILVATKYSQDYQDRLKKGINRIRRLEFILSGGLAVLTVALINGVSDVSTLLAIFALTEVLGLFLVIVEARKDVLAKHPRAANKLTFVASVTPWLIIAFYLFGAQIWGTTLPAYVYFIDGSLFLLTIAMAVIGMGQMRGHETGKGRFADPLKAEKAQIILSFVTYSALAWQIFFGVLR